MLEDVSSVKTFEYKIEAIYPDDIHHEIALIAHLQIQDGQTDDDRPLGIVEKEDPRAVEVKQGAFQNFLLFCDSAS